MITFRQKGDFSKLTRFLERAKESVRLGDLDKYGREGVAALRLQHQLIQDGQQIRGITRSSRSKVPYRSAFTTQIFKMESLLQLFCSTDMQQETAAGYRGETTSILLSSLFLTKLQMRHGRRLLSYEYNC